MNHTQIHSEKRWAEIVFRSFGFLFLSFEANAKVKVLTKHSKSKFQMMKVTNSKKRTSTIVLMFVFVHFFLVNFTAIKVIFCCFVPFCLAKRKRNIYYLFHISNEKFLYNFLFILIYTYI